MKLKGESHHFKWKKRLNHHCARTDSILMKLEGMAESSLPIAARRH
jgi:hypothetical protein